MTEIKICGLTGMKDADYVMEAGADYAGMVLYFPISKRNMDIEDAKKVLLYIECRKKTPVAAVTVSPTAEQTRAIVSAGFSFIQIHGTLQGETVEEIEERYASGGSFRGMIRAYNGSSVDLEEVKKLAEKPYLYGFLFDASTPGSGKLLDTEKLPDRKLLNGKKFFLAGGLDPSNVTDIIRQIRPDVVDVSSGVELKETSASELSDKKVSSVVGGGKDRSRIMEFVKSVEIAG